MTAGVLLLGAQFAVLCGAADAGAERKPRTGCRPEMVRVKDFCVDRYESSTVDKQSGQRLSPYYPPEYRLLRRVYDYWDLGRFASGDAAAQRMPLPELSDWQRGHEFQAMAVSLRGVVPQAYVSFHTAKSACALAGKRLCTKSEWTTACHGQTARKHPYGTKFRRGRCNVYRFLHPGFVLHGVSSVGHLDPRLNLLTIAGDDSVLWTTGSSRGCRSEWGDDGIYDMVGNLDEWVDEERGRRAVFRGGFYARSTTQGWEAKVTNHSKAYYDYSLGIRCCENASPSAPAD